MPETKSPASHVPPLPPDPVPPPSVPSPAPPQSGPDQTRLYQGPETVKPPGSEDKNLPDAKPQANAGARPVEAWKQPYTKPSWSQSTWLMLAAIVLLLVFLAIFIFQPRHRGGMANQPVEDQAAQENPDFSHYSAFVAKNKALLEKKYLETVLTDEPFAGQAPLSVRINGPLVSVEDDPKLAALVDAFRVRVQVMQGSQALVRGQTLTRIIKGDLRGFKVQASEKIEAGKVVFEEAQVTTPRNGVVRTANRVLDSLQRTDLAGVLAEVQAAGMEFSPLPAPAASTMFRGQLRFVSSWGKAVPEDRLIAGNGVGRLALGMPIAQMQNRLAPGHGVLRRKVLVNDAYYDIYKVTDQGGEPLLYVYEKQGKVWGISIVSEAFKTGKGVGINSTLDQIRLSYPQVKLAHSGKKTPFVQLEGMSGVFIIQGDGDKKVISILIGESPEFE